MGKVDLVLTGQLLAGAELGEASVKMANMTKQDPEKIRRLLSSGKATVIKKNLKQEAAERYQLTLERMGIEVMLRPSLTEASVEAEPTIPPPPPPEVSPEDVGDENAAKEGDSLNALQMESSPADQAGPPPDEPSSEPTWVPPPPKDNSSFKTKSQENPYAAPQAEVRDTPSGNVGEWSETPYKVPASHGWLWIKEGIGMLFERFWKWELICFLLLIGMGLVSLIPLVGNLVTSLFGPVVAGGLMLGAHGQRMGEPLPVGTIFRGFKTNFGQLTLLGLFYLLFVIAMALIGFLILGAGLLPAFMGKEVDPQALHLGVGSILLFILLVLVMGSVVTMAGWFAPALVALTDCSAIQGLIRSFKATAKNWLPFLVYFLVLIGLGIVIGILVAIVMSILGGSLFVLFNNTGGGPPSGGTVIFGMLIGFCIFIFMGVPAMAFFNLTVYSGLKDIFYEQ